ncbi:phage capsid protein [Pleomorphomonas koreensis]|uniref:phage capsid protein n=1 Tax=Pleomorphomonas koreensis TaxID=257440 RepID=UPI00042A5302|nr:phage capsid protein [Pleomorphomonas koreensis]
MTDYSTNPTAWFREVIVDKVTILDKTKGDYLAGMFMPGDRDGSSIKFPRSSTGTVMYPLTGAIEPVVPSGIAIDVVTCQPEYFEAAAFVKRQDINKIGSSPALQQVLADDLQRSQRVKKDTIKLNALSNFAGIETIGTGGSILDILDISEASDLILGVGEDEEIYCPIPFSWMTQLEMYKEFANSQWQGPTDLPLASRIGVRKRTWKGVNLFTVPDYMLEPFKPAEGELVTWAWSKSAMAAETPVDQQNVDISTRKDLQGNPEQFKTMVAGAAVGLNPKGVKKLRFKFAKRATRPVETVITEAAGG